MHKGAAHPGDRRTTAALRVIPQRAERMQIFTSAGMTDDGAPYVLRCTPTRLQSRETRRRPSRTVAWPDTRIHLSTDHPEPNKDLADSSTIGREAALRWKCSWPENRRHYASIETIAAIP